MFPNRPGRYEWIGSYGDPDIGLSWSRLFTRIFSIYKFTKVIKIQYVLHSIDYAAKVSDDVV